MRFFEYESRAIVAKAGIPVTKHGFAKTPDEARQIAEDIGGPACLVGGLGEAVLGDRDPGLGHDRSRLVLEEPHWGAGG